MRLLAATFREPEFEGSGLNLAGWVKKVTGHPTVSLGSVGLNSEIMDFFNENVVAEPAPLDGIVRRFDRGTSTSLASVERCWATPSG